MRIFAALGFVLGLLMFGSTGQCELLRQFDLDECTKNASDVVVAKQEGEEEGLRVIEVLKGNLKLNEVIEVERLKGYEPRFEVKGEQGDNAKSKTSNQRMILFLIDKGEEAEERWVGANKGGDARVSTIWVEEDGAYRLLQAGEEEGLRLSSWGLDKKRILPITKLKLMKQEVYQSILSIENKEERCEELVRWLRENPQWNTGYIQLGLCGKVAVRALMNMTQDNRYSQVFVINALASASGKEKGMKLIEVIEREMGLWKRTGELQAKWKNEGEKLRVLDELTRQEAQLLVQSCLRLQECLKQLELGQCWIGKPVVKQLRSMVETYPKYYDKIICRVELMKACDRFLEKHVP